MPDDKQAIADALTEAKRLTANVYWSAGSNVSHFDKMAIALELVSKALEAAYSEIDALKAQTTAMREAGREMLELIEDEGYTPQMVYDWRALFADDAQANDQSEDT